MVGIHPARIFIVDDHRVIRLGFRLVLERVGRHAVIGEAESGEEALKKITESAPDLAVVDIAMEGMDGIELTRRLKAQCPGLRVLIVSMHDDSYYVEAALAAGADGYVLKENADELMTKAVDELLGGRTYLCNEVARKLK